MTLYLKLTVVAALIAALYGAHHYIDKGGYNRANKENAAARNEAIIKQQDENLAITLAYAKKLTEGMVQHEKDKTIIAAARTAAGRVQVSFPTCPVSTITGTAEDSNESGRLATERVGIAFDRFRQGAEQLLADCAKLNSDAILSNSLQR